MKRVLSFILIILSIFNLTACTGYNKVMRNYLGDEKNYFSISAEFKCYEDYDDTMYIKIENNDSLKDSNGFDLFHLHNNEITLKLIGENYNGLKDLFINEEIKPGTTISLRCSTGTYMDTDFYYIAELGTEDKTYLTLEDGIKNIKDYMDHNKSLL